MSLSRFLLPCQRIKTKHIIKEIPVLTGDDATRFAQSAAHEVVPASQKEKEDADETIAYFSLLNDKIERDITDTNAWNRLSRQLPNIKRRSSHPSVKVGRLAVSKKYKGQRWGEQILSLLKEWFTHDNKTGCLIRYEWKQMSHGSILMCYLFNG